MKNRFLLPLILVTIVPVTATEALPPPATNSRLRPSNISVRLDEEATVVGYHLRPPRNYTPGQPESPDGSIMVTWSGALRKDHSCPALMMNIITSPAGEPMPRTAEQAAEKLLGGLNKRRIHWKQTLPQKQTIGGLTFVRIGWSGRPLKEKRTLQGVMYAAVDGDSVVAFFAEDIVSLSPQTLPLAEAAVHTFRKPPSQIYYTTQWPGHGQIYAMDPDGTHSVCLTPGSDTDYCPALSPDGKTIAFSTHRDGIRSLYLMNRDGTKPRRLTGNVDAGLCSWSPGAIMLVFSSNHDGAYCLYIMGNDSANVTKITQGPSDDFPAWSPLGTHIAFERQVEGKWRIFVVDLKSHQVKALTEGKWDDRWAQWSPDGEAITYTSYEHGNGDIFVMDKDGANKVQITTDPAEDRQASWTADSRHLLFHSNRAGKFDIYSLDLATLQTKRLTTETKDTAQVVTLGRNPSGESRAATQGK